MALQQLQTRWISEGEYLAGELISDIKHEYIDGEVYAMTGASANHGRIVGNLFARLHAHLAGTPCDVFAADMKVKTEHAFFYPDLIVDCTKQKGDIYFTESPLVIVEVLSKSTRKWDQTLKRIAYQSLPSLQEYVLIEQDFVDVEICRRAHHWQSEHHYLGQEITLSALALSLAVADLYAKVDNEDMRAWEVSQNLAP